MLIEETESATPVRSFDFLKRFWAGFHNSIIIAIIFTLMGISIGVKVAKDFYVEKVSEVVATGAMLHKSKVYTVNPKL